eukprot:4424001-Pleurochrysis_carterae.AAC.1
MLEMQRELLALKRAARNSAPSAPLGVEQHVAPQLAPSSASQPALGSAADQLKRERERVRDLQAREEFYRQEMMKLQS